MFRTIRARIRSLRSRLAAVRTETDPFPLATCSAWTDRLEVI